MSNNFSVSLLLKALDQASGPIGQVTNKIRRMNEESLRGAQEANLKRREQLRSEMVDAGALALALVAPIKKAMEFENAMANVAKVVDFKTPDGLTNMARTIKDLSTTIPLSKVGLAEIVEAGGQLGVASQDLEKFAITSAKMATAFDMMPGVAGEATAKLSNVLQIPITEISHLGDAINHLSNNTAAKASEIIEAVNRAGGTAKQFGLLPEEVAALSSAFISLGKKPEVAATGINAMLLRMQTATRQGKKFGQALQFLGVDARQLEKDIGQNAQGALTSFLETLEGLDKGSRAKVLTDLFGLEYADDISILVGSLDSYKKSLGLIGDASSYAGSMTNEFNARLSTTGSHTSRLFSSLGNVSDSFFNSLFPAIKAVSNALTPLLNGISYVIDAFPKLTAVMSIAVATMVTGKVAAIAFGYGFTFLKGAAISSALAMLKVGTIMRAVGAIAMANPIGAAVGAIALAATAIYKNWDGITNFFKGIFESLTDLMPDWLQNLMFGDDSDVATPSVKPIQYSEPLGKIVNSGAPEQRVGGELTVKFENAPAGMAITDAKNENPNFGINVHNGMMMVAQ